MKLYKSRDFSSFFTDTFEFIKQNGTHFFKQFIIINGIFVLILVAISYIFSSLFLNNYLEAITSGNAASKFEEVMNGNEGLFIGLIISLIIGSLIFGIISYAFTPIYFKLLEKNEDTNFNTSDIVSMYKANISKLLLFVALGILIGIPLALVFGIAAVIVSITIIGILLLPLLVALFTSIYNMTLLEYLDQKRSFFDCFSYSWSLIFSKFWPAVGCMGIFYVMSYVVQVALSLIQSIFNITSQLTIPNADAVTEDSSLFLIIVTLIFFIITFFVGILLNTILQINQSIVYYGLKEDKEQINTKSDIDLIGANNEQ